MHPERHARIDPERTAVVMASSGITLSYGDLDARSNQVAHLLRGHGLNRGDVVAVMLDNIPEYFEIVWGAQRAGLYFTCISSRLGAGEAAYIVRDSGARLLLTGIGVADVAGPLAALLDGVDLLMVGGRIAPYGRYEAARDAMPTTPIADQSSGIDMLYSSGTTGTPKGVKPPLPDGPLDQTNPLTELGRTFWGLSSDTIFLSPAPLYHSAPLRWCMVVHKLGGAVVVMEKFDAENALALIERHRVTHAQWVPTHFVRMLKLPEAVRTRHDLSSLRAVWHAAAPCPVPVKRAMIDWWGPLIHEFYSGTEANGLTQIDSADWLDHPGSVGRAVWGVFRIVDEDDEPVPPRTEGAIYVQDGLPFEYHNDPEKTAASRNRHGWTTLGDVGWLDEDGWLYLTDRASFMIISGGVNIYPQEIENLLVTHPKVADVAVIGAPDEEMGEKVVAVVQPIDWADAGTALADELTGWLESRISRIKLPRRIDFDPELPRHPTGKLYKRFIRDRYRQGSDTQVPRIVG